MIEIRDTPEVIQQLLSKLKTDEHLSKTFEGTAKNGKLKGSYTNLALINGMVIGYVKIVGVYHLQGGWIRLKAIPNVIFWIVIGFCVLATCFISLSGIMYRHFEVIGTLFFLFMAGMFTIIFLLERKSFYRELDRINNVNYNRSISKQQ